jgi:hypothetical protein
MGVMAESVLQLLSLPKTVSPYYRFSIYYKRSCRSQRRRSLRHEIASLAHTLGSCVRIPPEAWTHTCVYSVFISLMRGRNEDCKEFSEFNLLSI